VTVSEGSCRTVVDPQPASAAKRRRSAANLAIGREL
jgi:hypothetical protein